MRNGIEHTKGNPRVRILKTAFGYAVQVEVRESSAYYAIHHGPMFQAHAWGAVAERGNIKEARLLAKQFAALVGA